MGLSHRPNASHFRLDFSDTCTSWKRPLRSNTVWILIYLIESSISHLILSDYIATRDLTLMIEYDMYNYNNKTNSNYQTFAYQAMIGMSYLRSYGKHSNEYLPYCDLVDYILPAHRTHTICLEYYFVTNRNVSYQPMFNNHCPDHRFGQSIIVNITNINHVQHCLLLYQTSLLLQHNINTKINYNETINAYLNQVDAIVDKLLNDSMLIFQPNKFCPFNKTFMPKYQIQNQSQNQNISETILHPLIELEIQKLMKIFDVIMSDYIRICEHIIQPQQHSRAIKMLQKHRHILGYTMNVSLIEEKTQQYGRFFVDENYDHNVIDISVFNVLDSPSSRHNQSQTYKISQDWINDEHFASDCLSQMWFHQYLTLLNKEAKRNKTTLDKIVRKTCVGLNLEYPTCNFTHWYYADSLCDVYSGLNHSWHKYIQDPFDSRLENCLHCIQRKYQSQGDFSNAQKWKMMFDTHVDQRKVKLKNVLHLQ